MKSQSSTSTPRALLAAMTIAMVSVLGCAAPQKMESGAGVPASQGTVDATEGENGNTKLVLRVKHLAPPQKVAADATIYVVWIQPRNAGAQNVGALVLNDNLEGTLETLTPHRQFTVSVTPEPSAQVGQPTNAVVFTSEVDRGEP